MQTFDIHRFGKTLLWQIADRRKTATGFLAAGFLLPVVGGLLYLFSSYSIDNDAFRIVSNSYAFSVASIFYAFLVVYMLTLGTFIVSNISEKKSRINAFLLPASKLEKFTSRYIFLLIFIPLLAFAGIVIGDLVQMLILKIAIGDAYSVTNCLFNSFGVFRLDASQSAVSFFALWLVHSFMLLLGTVFRRRAWIKSALAAVAIVMVLGIVFAVGAKGILDLLYGSGNYNVVVIDAPWVSALTCLVMFAVTAFNYWVAYSIYARMQAVNNKWYNL